MDIKKIVREKCINSLDELLEKYDNESIIEKISYYISSQLPIIIKNFNKELIKKIDLTTEQDYFVELFLSHNRYYYIPNTEKFVYYDNLNYTYINEDDILHKILTTISNETKVLQPKKHQTVKIIMKRIKENNLLYSIPESETIQLLLNKLYELRIFNTKQETKYFLTIIGDNILKKNTNLIHLMDMNTKEFINNINNCCQMIIGCNCINTIKYKFHDHIFDNTRLFNNRINVPSNEKWNKFLTESSILLLTISCHYSNKYKNSDNCLEENNIDECIREHIIYLKGLTSQKIIKNFVNEYIEVTKNPTELGINTQIISANSEIVQIGMKDMLYLWKHYLDSLKIPNVVFSTIFKKEIVVELEEHYYERLDTFLGLSSKYLPNVYLFLEYWNNNIEEEYDDDFKFEITEIITLFKLWLSENYNSSINLSEKKVIDIIEYFYADNKIINNKYITNIRHKMWNKDKDIISAVDSFIDELLTNNQNATGKRLAIYDIYNYYCSNNKLIVSKKYFDKVIKNNWDKKYINENGNGFLIIA
jgi:hypothetical protein